MTVYELFRDEVTWEVAAEADATYPGLRAYAAPVTIPARVLNTTEDVAGDRVSQLTVWTFPEHEVRVGDRLDSGEVLTVDSARDGAGNVRYWISRVQR